LGHELARSTIAAILTRHGIEPAPERRRQTTWKEFLTRHWELIVAADFFTVEVWTRKGLQRFVVLFLIDLGTRNVQIAGITSTANGWWMSQRGRRVTDVVDGIASGKRYLIHDRDPLFTAEFLIPSCIQTCSNPKVGAKRLECAHPNRYQRQRSKSWLRC
jgi:putative transposase